MYRILKLQTYPFTCLKFQVNFISVINSKCLLGKARFDLFIFIRSLNLSRGFYFNAPYEEEAD